MGRQNWDREFKHIVDLDGQLLGIDASVVDASILLKRAGHAGSGRLALLQGEREIPLEPHQAVALSETTVLHFRSQRDAAWPALLAA